MTAEIKWDGMEITKDGVYSGIPINEYHHNIHLTAGYHVSKSSLNNMAPPEGNPKKFWAYWLHNPDRIVKEETEALALGKAVHALLLGDEVFHEAFAVRPDKAPDGTGRDWHGSNKSCKAWLEDQWLQGKTILRMEQIEQIRRMAHDVAQLDIVAHGALNGRIERSMIWQDPQTKIWLKVRPDVIPTDSGIYADLKTAARLDEDVLSKQYGDLGYYLQPALVRMGCRHMGLPFESFHFVYTHSTGYADSVSAEVTDAGMDMGEEVVRYCLDRIRTCLDDDEWPGMQELRGDVRMHMKPWHAERIDIALKKYWAEKKPTETEGWTA